MINHLEGLLRGLEADDLSDLRMVRSLSPRPSLRTMNRKDDEDDMVACRWRVQHRHTCSKSRQRPAKLSRRSAHWTAILCDTVGHAQRLF